MGTKYIGLGSIPDFKKKFCDMAMFEKFVADITPAVDKIYDAGCKFMYHNHAFEFLKTPNGNLIEMLCDIFPAEKFGITLDTYWVQVGGGDPAYWLRKLKGRVNCVHFKDMVYWPEDIATRMAPIGQGNMNYPEILKACADADVEVAYIEQDKCYDADPFECLRTSFEYLKSFGLN